MLRSKFVNTHIPEQAVKLEPVVARTEDDPAAVPTSRTGAAIAALAHARADQCHRRSTAWPADADDLAARLLPVQKATGPERIEAEWWRSGKRLCATGAPAPVRQNRLKPGLPQLPGLEPFQSTSTVRDYYVIEDEGGRRFWVFRVGLYGAEATPRWFLHGFFA